MTATLEQPAPTPTGQPAVAARDITKTFTTGGTQVPVLHGVSLEARPGEMVAVMGASGSGKSTLLYCLAGLERPDAGEVVVNGRNLAECSRADLARMRRGEVGFVFQAYNLVPTLTAFENVCLPHLLRHEKADVAVVEGVLESVGLAHRRDARPPSMSGGEQQRVALARVLAQQPSTIFADEPTGALDSRSSELVLGHLGRLAHRDDACVVVVTHDPTVAASCDRILFMRDGLLVDELRPTSTEQVARALAGITSRRGER